MRIPTISNETATTIWVAMEDKGQCDASDLPIEFVGDDSHARLTSLDLSDLADDLDAIHEEFKKKYPNGLPKSAGGQVDSQIVVPVHKHLSALADISQLSQIGFWRWLSNSASNGKFWRFIEWRFSDKDGKPKQQINWGITNPSRLYEVYLFRAWLRAHMMYDDTSADPYEYAKKGGSDIWRSHILRQDFGRDLNFRKAFLDVLIDSDGNPLVTTRALREEVIPAIRAWTSGGSFSHLTYDEAADLIKILVEKGA